MKAIRVNKVALVSTLKKNRDNHRKIFLEAVDGYKKTIIKELEFRLEQAKKGKRVEHFINIQQPQDQTRDYDRVLGMLDMSLDTEVDLTEQDYQAYVLDDWGWKKNFLHSNALYSKTAADTVASVGIGEED